MSVPASVRGSAATPLAATADTRVDLDDAGQPTVVLATAAELGRVTGTRLGTPLDLAVYPDPTGDRVAVVVDPLTADPADLPVVILDRRGRVLASILAGDGPAADAQPTWSPDGQRLAYPTVIDGRPAVAVIRPGGRPAVYRVADPGTRLGRCVWAPTDTAVVCPGRSGSRLDWYFAELGRPGLTRTAADAWPVAWLADRRS